MPASSGSRESPAVKKDAVELFADPAIGLELIDPVKLYIIEAALIFGCVTVRVALEIHVHIVIGRHPQ